MKNIVIFSNPFGNGPAGKAISIARYIADHSDHSKVKIFLCGGPQLESLAEKRFDFIKADERNELEIFKAISSIEGKKYVISSQNRFAIRVAVANFMPNAFLDGLAWFWKDIPEEHFLADIIFWLNYPGIKEKIPILHKNRIQIIHGVTEKIDFPHERVRENNILIYLGGCKNPITSLPTSYIDLFAKLIESIKNAGVNIDITTDTESQCYMKKYPSIFSLVHNYEHRKFLLNLSRAGKFITNGGQTATMEAASIQTPISFFLPINLSQYALINKINTSEKVPHLDWQDYVTVPNNILEFTERDAVAFFNQKSFSILCDSKKFNQLRKDFLSLLTNRTANETQSSYLLQNIGSTGAQDIYEILKNTWGI